MKPRVLGVIPARGGSKGIPRKNLALLAGRPLFAYTLEAAARSQLERWVVSTDDAEIAACARSLGAEVLERPPELAADTTPALPVMAHACEASKAAGFDPEAVCYLQPTSPLRTAAHIDGALELFAEERPDTVVSVVEVPHAFHPGSVMRLREQQLEPYQEGALILRRQDKPLAYARNGPAVLIVSREALAQGSLYSGRTLPLHMEWGESHDVDTQEDLDYLEWLLARRAKSSS